MSKTIAIVNRKGGVGKTTSAWNLGTALSRRGQRTLLIDLDPQKAGLSHVAGVRDPERGVADMFTRYLQDRTPQPLDPYIVALAPNLDLLPASKELNSAEIILAPVFHREHVLAAALEPAQDRYDMILIDCGPSMGILVVNALVAADEVLIPVEAEYLAAVGLTDLFDTINTLRRERLNTRLRIGGIILTKVDARIRHDREIVAGVREAFGATIPVLGEIKRSASVKDATQAGQSIFDYAKRDRAAIAYAEIADALVRSEAAPSDEAAPAAGGTHG